MTCFFLQTENALRSNAKRDNLKPRPGRHNGVPDLLSAFGRHMNLPAGLSDKADAQQQRRHPGHGGVPAGHIGKSLRRQVNVRELAEDLSGLRSGDIHGRQPAGHIGHMRAQVRAGHPPFEPLFDEFDIAGGGRQKEMVIGQTGNRAIINNDPAVVAHHPIADTSDPER